SARADAPQWRRAPQPLDTAVELHLVECRPHVVILGIAVDAANRVRVPPGQPTVSLLVCQVLEFSFEAFRAIVIGNLYLEESSISLVALRVIPGAGIVGMKMPIRRVAAHAAN